MRSLLLLLHTAFNPVCHSVGHLKPSLQCVTPDACVESELMLQVVVKPPPAFHLFYATGWQDAVVHMRLTSPSNQQPQVLFSTPVVLHVASGPLRFMT